MIKSLITVKPGKPFTIPFNVNSYVSISNAELSQQPESYRLAIIVKPDVIDNVFSRKLNLLTTNLKFDNFDLWTTYSGITIEKWNTIKEQGLKSNDFQIDIDEKGVSINSKSPFPPSVLIIAVWNDRSSGIYPYIMNIQCTETENNK
jgi:hypothetical protein